MFKIAKPEYTVEVKDRTVKRVRDGQGSAAVANDPGLIAQTLGSWAKAANRDSPIPQFQ